MAILMDQVLKKAEPPPPEVAALPLEVAMLWNLVLQRLDHQQVEGVSPWDHQQVEVLWSLDQILWCPWKLEKMLQGRRGGTHCLLASEAATLNLWWMCAGMGGAF